MKYMRKTAGYTWTDYKINTATAKKLILNRTFGQNTGIQTKMVAKCKANFP